MSDTTPRRSEQINELATALAKAQAAMDPFAESAVLYQYRRLIRAPQINRGARVVSVEERFFEKIVMGATDCWYWIGGRHHLGYGLLGFNGESKAHRVSWILHNGPIPDGMGVLHRCDVRSCVNPEHLFLGTQADNIRDMFAKGRNRCVPRSGESNGQAKLTWEIVRKIRRDFPSISQRALARQYGVGVMTINRIIRHELWKDSNDE